MPFCPSCGSEHDGTVRFCSNCGTKLIDGDQPADQPVEQPIESAEQPVDQPVEQPTDASESAYESIPQPEPAPAIEPDEVIENPVDTDAPSDSSAASQAAAAAAASAYVYTGPGGNQSYQPYQQAPQPGFGAAADTQSSSNAQAAPGQASNQGAYQQGQDFSSVPHQTADGVIKQGWEDIKTSDGWFGKIALLSLIGFIPILNFVVEGFAALWGRKAAFRSIDKLNQPIFAEESFKIGFFIVVFDLVVSIVMSFVSMLLAFIPIIGWVADFLLVIAIMPCVALGNQRIALTGRLGAAFELKTIYAVYRRNLGGALATFWLPGIIVAVVISAIILAITLVCGLSIASLGYAVAGGYIGAFLTGGGIIAAVFGSYVCIMAGVCGSLIVSRAFGYWIGRFAPEWKEEAIAAGRAPRT